MEALQNVNKELKRILGKKQAEETLFEMFGFGDVTEFRALERKWRKANKPYTIADYLKEKARDKGVSVDKLADQIMAEVRKNYGQRRSQPAEGNFEKGGL